LGERELFARESTAELTWLAAGNALYYVVGITLAAVLKDNRAFCKYVCPVPVLQKIGARFALWRMKIDPDTCIDCGLCEKHCPMDIKLLDYKEAGQRILSTECIFCETCADVCPTSAISMSMNQFDVVREEHLRYKSA
jgi:polyferredoxin